MRAILGIDPGPRKSGYVVFHGGSVWDHGVTENRDIIVDVVLGSHIAGMAIELPTPRGYAIGQDTLDTSFEAGRIVHGVEVLRIPWIGVRTQDMRRHITGNANAKDRQVRTAIIASFGGECLALGAVRCKVCQGRKLRGRGKQRGPCADCEGSGWEHPPGPLYGLRSHEWPALGIALYGWDHLQLG